MSISLPLAVSLSVGLMPVSMWSLVVVEMTRRTLRQLAAVHLYSVNAVHEAAQLPLCE